MGPNSLKILEELMQGTQIEKGLRVLDLGCGKGLTSIFLAKEYDVQVFAVDLWISPTDNYERFKALGLEKNIIPLCSDASSLPFADDYFDAVISVDAYHYFGNNDSYFDNHLSGVLKQDALVALAIPGMQYEVHDNVPSEMNPYWSEDALATWHSVGWWKDVFRKSKYFEILKIEEMSCFGEVWSDWLGTDNEYAVEDREMIKMDDGRYMNLISIIGKNRKK